MPWIALASLQVALKLKTILEQAEVGDERRRPDGIHLCHERGQLARVLRG